MTETLDRLNAQPTSQGRTTVLAEMLQPQRHATPTFADELAQLVERVKAEPPTAALFNAVQYPGRQPASRIRRALPSAWAARHRSRLAEVAVAPEATENGGSSP
jgi:hypothetical protein